MGDRSGTVDVLVIGAGASGATFAWSLSEAGIEVMPLEQYCSSLVYGTLP